MEANKIMQSDVLDILFEDRNKAYGAYELRRSYNKRILTALGITVALGLVIFLSSFLANNIISDSSKLDIKDVELINVKEEPPPPVEPPPPPPPMEPPPKVEMTKFTPPDIVKDEEVKKEDIPPDVEKLEDTKIDVVSQEGIKSTDIAVPVVDEGKNVVVVKDETNYDQTFTKVEVEADFPGGMGAWKKYLERNLSGDVASSGGAPAGSYTVTVQFIVDKEGIVSDVKAQSNHGYGLEEEAVRVVKRSGKWKPAIQNGREVKAYRKQPITFVVNEGE